MCQVLVHPYDFEDISRDYKSHDPVCKARSSDEQVCAMLLAKKNICQLGARPKKVHPKLQ